MKILVTGTKGYIASSFKGADRISLRDDAWRRKGSFAGYDAILHTVGLAHVRESILNQYVYYAINRDLSFDVAKKAKEEGVKQFIFISSLSVYGLASGIITADTPTKPTTNYGRSKLAAEGLINGLADDSFKVAILRPPMVYGLGSPGNYSKLSKLIRITPIFPDYDNLRSLVSIENLSAQISAIIESGQGGLYFPCDPEPISTRQLAENIAADQGKTLKFTKLFNKPITALMPYVGSLNKLFGTLVVDVNV